MSEVHLVESLVQGRRIGEIHMQGKTEGSPEFAAGEESIRQTVQ